MSGEPATIPDLLVDAARSRPDAVFLRDAGLDARASEEVTTYAGLDELVDRVAAGLVRRGVTRGDRVAVALPNGLAWIAVLFATLRLGAVLVTLNVRYRETELEHMINDSGATVVVTAATAGDVDLAAVHAGLGERTPAVTALVVLGGASGLEALTRDQAHARADGVPAPADPAVILYTSGTTGTPKGAVLTHASLLAAARAEAAHLGLHDGDRFLATMPFTHVGGLTCTVLSALVAGAEVVLTPGFSPAGALRDVTGHGVTVFAGVPTMWTLMLAEMARTGVETLPSLRFAVAGGANVEPALCTAIIAAAPHARLVNLYGLSECSGAAVMSALDDDVDTVATTLGVPLPGVEARVVGPDGDPVAPGSDGELWLRGASVADGYWNRNDATFRGDSGQHADRGWLATGDVVAASPDGHLALRGRLTEMFVQGGYNVYPVEVENVLTGHDGVSLAAGIGAPDATYGEVGHYFVVRAEGSSVTADELRAHVGARLADYKVPRRVEFVDDLPLTPAGKIAKAALRRRVTGG